MTYNGVFGDGTFSGVTFLYQSCAKDTNELMSYLCISYLYIFPCLNLKEDVLKLDYSNSKQ